MSSKQLILSTYRQLLKEVDKQFTYRNNNKLWREEVISTYQKNRDLSNKEEIENSTKYALDILCFLRSSRKYNELLELNNPAHGYSVEKRIELTANRVGLKLPIVPLARVLDEEGPEQTINEKEIYTETDKVMTNLATSRNILFIGIIFHVAYIWSIFDIYFTSPLVHGMTTHKVDLPPPANRLVLIIGDGLRADKLYQLYSDESDQPITKAPFLRDIILNHGTFGVSHTRVPTESRPGHVALIAGFYEDVSAVTKEFDSVFNQSRHTWSFGSPDILPMFADGASDPDKVETFMYGHESENFAKDAKELDIWVFDQLAQLFTNSSSNAKLYQQLHDDQIVIFLHLLGLDTNGHVYGPHSKEYIDNIKVVDEGINKAVRLIEEYYGHDGKTSYVFTADHGMSNRGNHGDGHPDNTRTPIIAWGAGVNKPNKTHPTGHDEFSADWYLNEVQRNDVLQADIAPFMASLIGINYPVNSVGELPLVYLNNTPLFKAQSLFVNAKEISEQYQVKYELKKRTEIMFKPFAPLSNSTHNREILLSKIQELIDTEQYEEAEIMCEILIQLSLEGLRYFQTYDWLMLRSIVTVGYLGWIFYSLKHTLKEYCLPNNNSSNRHSDRIAKYVNILAIISLTILMSIMYIQGSPATYYTYVIFAVYFCWNSLLDYETFTESCKLALGSRSPFILAGYIIGHIIALEIFVYSYFERSILSGCFVLGVLWPLIMPSSFRSENKLLLLYWSISCLASSIFTLLPVEKGEDILLVVYGGILILITGINSMVKSSKYIIGNDSDSKTMIIFQLLLVALSIIIVYDTTNKLKWRVGLPILNQYAAWIILAISTATPFFYGLRRKQHYLKRLTTLFLAFAPLFVILSISYEVLFYYFLTQTVLLWLEIERKLFLFEQSKQKQQEQESHRKLEMRDSRISLIFLFFIKVGFFGTGNVASLSSFSLQSVYRLTTIFNPFLMGGLLLLKILIPFFIVSSVFYILNKSIRLSPFSLFLLVLSISDIMTLNFFYLVRDDGSWLEIGTTISHFVISSLFVLFMILLFLLSEVLVGKVIIPEDEEKEEKKREKND
ncbi:6661_t:CDS:10 [Rhizophagus irregularis]|nr:6661_t:CDS:10 [Rhizophagus irregularis]